MGSYNRFLKIELGIDNVEATGIAFSRCQIFEVWIVDCGNSTRRNLTVEREKSSKGHMQSFEVEDTKCMISHISVTSKISL